MKRKWSLKKCIIFLLAAISLLALFSCLFPIQNLNIYTNDNHVLSIASQKKPQPSKTPLDMLRGVEDFRERREEVKDRLLAESNRTYLLSSSLNYFFKPCLIEFYISIQFNLRE